MKRFLKGLLAVLLLTTAAHAADINSLSTTDASNSSCWSEGMAASNVNNCARADLGLIARWYKDWNGSLASGGSSNAYTLSANQTLSAYFDGLTVTFEANHTNTGPATLNVDAVGAATISKYGAVELESGDVAAGQKYTVVYDGSRFQLVNSITPFASTVTSGNIPLFSGTTGRFTDSGRAISSLPSSVLDEDDMSSNSATAVPTQQSVKAYVDTTTAAARDFEFVSTAAITAAASLVVTGMEAGYDYFITLEAFAPGTDAEILFLRFSDDAGVSYEADASDYSWGSSVSTLVASDAADSAIRLNGAGGSGTSLGNDAGNVNTVEVKLINPNASSEKTTATWHGVFMGDAATPATIHATGGGIFQQGADAVAAVQFTWSGAGNFKAQGDITVYRRKRS